MPASAIGLGELLEQVQDSLKSQFEGNYWIVAEIASLSGSRHLYFELIEKSGGSISAKCRANLWARNATRVLTHFQMITRESLKPGMKVMLNVSLEFHTQYGLSLTIQDIDPSFSLGEFERIKQQTIESLQADGLLEMNKAIELTTVLQNLAVVSSATAAGYQDFVEQLNGNEFGYGFKVHLFPALVQGEKAPVSLLSAINNIEKSKESFDTIIILRGGGSVVDLSCFDDYEFNFNLAQSTFPIITGIGHERDQSVSDLVAHTHLKTPTAVAQFLVNHNAQFENTLFSISADIGKNSIALLDENHSALNQKESTLQKGSNSILARENQHQHYLIEKLLKEGKYRIQDQHKQNENIEFKMRGSVAKTLTLHQEKLIQSERIFGSYHPDQILRRGFAIFKNADNIGKGDEITIETIKQIVTATVNKIKTK